MTPLRRRMLEDMQLRGFSARTQECYASAVRQLAEHYHRSPDHLTEEDLRQYFLYLANEKQVARATATIALCAIRFFFEQTLRREWTTLRFVRPAREHKLPVVLSRDEVRRVLTAVRIPVYRVCLTTIYACGLRLLEGARLQVADVDSARMVVHVHGKGKQDRYVPAAGPDPPGAARVLADASVARVDVSRTDPPRAGAQLGARRRPRHTQQCTECFSPRRSAVASRSARMYTRCGIRTRLTCWKPASICGSSKTPSAIAVRGRPRSTRISRARCEPR